MWYTVHTSSSSSRVQGADLVIDDSPGVRHHLVILLGKGMVAGPGGSEAVA